MYLVISTSLNPKSRSRVLAREITNQLKKMPQEVELLDLQEFPLPFCDASSCYGDQNAQQLGQKIQAAKGVILASPIYNFDVSAAAKNVVELTGRDAWTEKVVGFVCAAGGEGSYMSPMGLACSLMLDFRSFIIPRFVYALGQAFDKENNLIDDSVRDRLNELARTVVKVSEALADG